MKLVKILGIALALTALVLILGCTDRGSNPDPYADLGPSGGLVDNHHSFYHPLMMQLKNDFGQMQIETYYPDIHNVGSGAPYPVLILLPPQDGDQWFYFNHGLKGIADEMIAKGEIDTMVIVCPGNDQNFGGYFFASGENCSYSWIHHNGRDHIDSSGVQNASPAAGDYDAVIGGQLLDYLQRTLSLTNIHDRTKCGIGGIGMGAYGAFRAAMKHPDAFSSISASDGPLDFDGSDGNGGFVSLVDSAFGEQGLTPANYKSFGASGPVSRLFVGGSLAFSPYDSAVQCSVIVITRVINGDSVETNNIRLYSRTKYADTTTLISQLVSSQSPSSDFDFLLPFDANGQMYDPVWRERWLHNNLQFIRENESQAASAFNNLRMWFGVSDQARFGFHNQTMSWISTLEGYGYGSQMHVESYDGYSGNPAYSNQYVYDLIRKMLIFHDRNFRGLPIEDPDSTTVK